jgi:hypothetical protein
MTVRDDAQPLRTRTKAMVAKVSFMDVDYEWRQQAES